MLNPQKLTSSSFQRHVIHIYFSVFAPLTWAALFAATLSNPLHYTIYRYHLLLKRELVHLCLDLYKKERKKERKKDHLLFLQLRQNGGPYEYEEEDNDDGDVFIKLVQA